MFVTREEVQEYAAALVAEVAVSRLAAGTVVTSPAAVATDQLTVVMEPSALAVPVKALRGQVLPGERVVLALVGADPCRSEWVCLGPFNEPATASSESINAQAVTSGIDTVTSTSYVNMAGTGSVTSLPFTKRFVGTRLKVDVRATMYATTATQDAFIGVRINGTDYDVVKQPAVLNERQPFTAITHIENIPAGEQTVQMRWRRTSTSGTPTRDTADWLSVCVEEVP